MPFKDNVGFDYDAKTPFLPGRVLKEAGQIKVKFPRLNKPINNVDITINLQPLLEKDTFIFPGYSVLRVFTDMMVEGKRNSYNASLFSTGNLIDLNSPNWTGTVQVPSDLDEKGQVVLGQITVGTRTFDTKASVIAWVGQEFPGTTNKYPLGEAQVLDLNPVTVKEDTFFYKDSK